MKQIENTLQDLKCMLIEDGYTEANIVLRTLIKAQEQVKNCDLAVDVVGRRELLLDFIQWLEDEHDIEFITPDKHEQLDIYMSSNSG